MVEMETSGRADTIGAQGRRSNEAIVGRSVDVEHHEAVGRGAKRGQEEVGLAHALRLHEFSLEGVENAVGIGGDEAAIAETLP